jgi:hypothetical protein
LKTVPRDEDADERHDDLLDEGIDDLAEGGTDDDANGKVDDIPLEGEILELLEEGECSFPARHAFRGGLR